MCMTHTHAHAYIHKHICICMYVYMYAYIFSIGRTLENSQLQLRANYYETTFYFSDKSLDQ